jgi:hypothetical protein
VLIVLLAWLLLAAAVSSPAAPVPLIQISPAPAELGEVWQFREVEATFTLTNHDSRAHHLLGADAPPGCQVAYQPDGLIPAGGTLQVTVRHAIGKLGRAGFRVPIRLDVPGAEERKLALEAFVQTAYEPESPLLELGDVDRRQGTRRALQVFTREAAHLGPLRVEGAPDWLKVSTSPVQGADIGIELSAVVEPDSAPLGPQAGSFRVLTDLPQQPVLEVQYRGGVWGEVVVEKGRADFGAFTVGQQAQATARLRSRSGQPFSVTKLRGEGVSAHAAPCEDVEACQDVVLEIVRAEAGPFGGRIEVEVAPSGERLPIVFGGIAMKPGASVQQLAAPPDAPPPPPPPLPTPSVPSRPSDVKRVTLRWQAGAEAGIQGYAVYRALRREGPFLRIGGRLLPVPDDGAATHDYRFVDDAVQAGATYHYYVDAVTTGGRHQRFSPVLTRAIAADARPPDQP